MVRVRVGMFVATLLATLGMLVPTARAAELPVVTIAITAADLHDRVQNGPCSWNYNSPVASHVEVTVTRTGPLDDPLVVDLTHLGPAHDPAFATLAPNSLVIPSAAASATFSVDVLEPIGPRTVSHALNVQIAPSAQYTIGTPSFAIVELATDRDPSLPPDPCDWGAYDHAFTGTVGESFDNRFGQPSTVTGYRWFATLGAIALRYPVTHGLRLVSGELPPGITIDAGGAVRGEPTAAGSFASEWEVCLPDAAIDLGVYAEPYCTTFSVTFDVAALPVVTVRVEPTGPSVIPECNDVVVFRDAAFTFTRTGDDAEGLTVTYAVGGQAVAGQDYVALPGTVVIPAGEDSVTVVPEMLFGDRTEIVDVTLTVVDGDDYDVGAASSAAGLVVSPRDPLLGPYVCGWRVAPESTDHDIEVGDVPAPLVAQEGGEAVFGLWGDRPAVWRVLGGALPPGVELADDGSFTGAAATSGTYVATVEACHPSATDPPACATADVTIEVHPAVDVGAEDDDAGPGGLLPRTGAETPAVLTLVGIGALLAGALLTRPGRRRAV
ncbi:MAG TPA: LPXTG cell wall anchor domain-containing protein [Acidimicrobiia bacterium]|nr:LPXTG cell wall anchor domain-containing protein [Acidimicrobiia bacterium]